MLFPAGLAPNHDNLGQYADIRKGLARQGVESQIHLDRDPLNMARIIGESFLWIGSSLHGRIIAASYDVPRVSLLNTKVEQYAKKWDTSYPYEISIENLCEAVERAKKNDEVSVAEGLSERAYGNIKSIIEVL